MEGVQGVHWGLWVTGALREGAWVPAKSLELGMDCQGDSGMVRLASLLNTLGLKEGKTALTP